MNRIFMICLAVASIGIGASACTGSAEHGHEHAEGSDHGSEAHTDGDADIQTADHSQFGHLSAVYLCGTEELQTTHTDKETKLAYKGKKIDVSRKVSILDNAFAGETFKGKFNGQKLIFKGKGYDASLSRLI